ncbi:tail completion and sheath stabilizer [Synechococcus phage syn9]|jgi:hypothetical protein|uniref:Tail completion and sheath stabilizer n=1 Tax=Synechococcus phage syn9 TaxID=382359 RepID=Q0QZ88_BPSYS|nr:tail completion and sheath stabilizer [Synechococcus phage syn9]ABA47108.1 tail completion and sheath stabilizer [Synechococcus phage syn9]AGH56536.1 tail completion and sheath stabilizer [Cyanophage Syn10]
MANWYQEQLTNKNFLSPIGFLFLLDKAPKVSFLCQQAEIPSITLGSTDIPTGGYVSLPLETSAEYGELNIQFIVDEDLKNYMELHNWIRALGTPQDFNERGSWITRQMDGRTDTQDYTDDPRYSDATLQVLNNNNQANFNVVFKDLFPIRLDTISFDVTGSDNDYFTSTATFQYTLYEIRNVSSTSRRTT